MVKLPTPKSVSVKEFQKQLQGDRLTRMRFINGIANLLEDMGVSSKEISDGLPNTILPSSRTSGGEVAVVVISKTDSQKNSTSIVVC